MRRAMAIGGSRWSATPNDTPFWRRGGRIETSLPGHRAGEPATTIEAAAFDLACLADMHAVDVDAAIGTRRLVSYDLCTITEDPDRGMPRDSVTAIAVTWCSSLPRLFGL